MRCLTRSSRFGHIILIILARSVDEAAGHEELVRSSRSSRLTCRRRRVHVGDAFRRHRDELGCIHLDLHRLLGDASSACCPVPCAPVEDGEGSFLLSQSPFLLSRYSVRILSVFCPYSVVLTEYGILSTRREYTEYVKNTRYSVHQNTWSVFCPYSAYSVIR